MKSSVVFVLFLISMTSSFFANVVFRSIAKKNKILITLIDKNRKFYERPTLFIGDISIFFSSIMDIFIGMKM